MKLFSVLALMLVISGCSLVPDSLEVADKNTLVAYSDVSSAPEKHKGQPVRWGGIIASVENKKEVTIVEVVQLPILPYGRPNVARDSLGRYRVYVEDFLDPVVYQPGRSITFVGDVTGSETGAIGEHTYFYPTIKASNHELWSDIERIDISGFNSPYFGFPYYGHFYYNRGFYGRGFGHFGGFGHSRVTIRKNPYRSSGRVVRPTASPSVSGGSRNVRPNSVRRNTNISTNKRVSKF